MTIRQLMFGPMDMQWTKDFFGTWFKILLFIGGLIYSYADIKHSLKMVPDLDARTTRIERYLSSHDSNYWQIVKQEN